MPGSPYGWGNGGIGVADNGHAVRCNDFLVGHRQIAVVATLRGKVHDDTSPLHRPHHFPRALVQAAREFSRACEFLEPRWTIQILTEFWNGSTRFNDIRKGMGNISSALLSRRLKEMEALGLAPG